MEIFQKLNNSFNFYQNVYVELRNNDVALFIHICFVDMSQHTVYNITHGQLKSTSSNYINTTRKFLF